MIETGLTFTIYPMDDVYHYEVHCGSVFSIEYVEEGRDDKPTIGFGSAQEMEAVAIAMLKAAQVAKEMGMK